MTEDKDITEFPGQTHIEWKIKKISSLTWDYDHYIESSPFSLGDTFWYLFTYLYSKATIENSSSKEEIVEISASNSENAGNSGLSGEIAKHFALSDGKTENFVDGIALYLVKEISAKNYRIAYKMGIKKFDGSELVLFEETIIFDKKKEAHGQAKLIGRSELLNSGDDLTPNDTIIFFCTARIVDVTASELQTSSSEGVSTLTKDFKDLYISRRYSDVILNVKSKKFHAHKAVLAARSTMFSTMIENDMVEKSGGIMDIPDCDPDTFDRFLLFLYTGKLESMSCREAISLYKTAAKYNLNDLKEECMYFMRRQLCVHSFFDVAQLAITWNKTHLQYVITDYFINNADSILKTPQWITFLRENTIFANKLFLEVLSERNSCKN